MEIFKAVTKQLVLGAVANEMHKSIFNGRVDFDNSMTNDRVYFTGEGETNNGEIEFHGWVDSHARVYVAANYI